MCVGGQKGEGDRRGEREQGEREDWGAGGKRTREQGDGERLVVVKALNHQLNEGYCGILW